jgi:hypothetical protein
MPIIIKQCSKYKNAEIDESTKIKTKLRNHMYLPRKAKTPLIEMKMMVTRFPMFGHMRRPINAL